MPVDALRELDRGPRGTNEVLDCAGFLEEAAAFEEGKTHPMQHGGTAWAVAAAPNARSAAKKLRADDSSRALILPSWL